MGVYDKVPIYTFEWFKKRYEQRRWEINNHVVVVTVVKYGKAEGLTVITLLV